MGETKIFNRDSRKLSKFIPLENVDFIVFSPPYWNLRNYGFKNQIGFKQSYEKYLQDMEKVFSECYKVLKKGRFMVINIGTVVSNEGMKFIAGDFVNKCIEAGFIFRKDVIWHKPRGTTKWQRGATQFSQNPYPLMFNTNINHEFVLIFQKEENGQIDFNKIPKFNRHFVRKLAYSVWDIIPVNSPKKEEKHVAPFPEELPRRMILLFTFKGETVLDPFAGCGTTNKVAKELGRNSIAVEMSKEYCKLIKNKMKSVEFGSLSMDIYNHNLEYEIDLARERMEKAKKEYQKAEKAYKNVLKKTKKESGLNKFMTN